MQCWDVRKPSIEDGDKVSRFVDLSRTLVDGMITYPGLPAPSIGAFRDHEASRGFYAPGTEFHVGRIELVTNTGTYIDAPFHRYRAGADLAGLDLARIADLPCVVVRAPFGRGRSVDAEALRNLPVRGCAVLVHTGWSELWGSDRYFEGHPFLTEDAARGLVAEGATLVGIDSLNIDDTSTGERPVHSQLLASGIPVVEHLCGLEQVPDEGARFFAVPPRVRGLGSFPVRAFAILPD